MKFSMILPVHNAAAFMGNALESIRRQSWKDYELIIKTYQDYAEQERRISDEQYDVSFESRKEIEHPGNQA